MKTLIAMALAAAALGAGGAAWADRVAGIASIPPAKAAAPPSPAVAAVPLQMGTLSALRSDGAQIEIDGKWWLVKPGRTQLLRNGLPVDASALAKGQKLAFTAASATPGETALGVVHVP